MSERKANNPSDPWSINYFDPPNPSVGAPPSPHLRERKPRLIPEIDRLFAVQDDLTRAVNALHDLEREHGKDKGFRTAQVNVENAYKVINRYLREYGTSEVSFK